MNHPTHDDVLGGGGHAVLQEHPLRQFLQGGGVGDAPDVGAVSFRDVVLGVRQFIKKVAVVGEKNQAVRVRVQAPHGPQQGTAGQVH